MSACVNVLSNLNNKHSVISWCHISGDNNHPSQLRPGVCVCVLLRLSAPYLCDGQLQLNHVLRLGHRRLQGCIQQQDAVQVLPASHCIVIHKKHLVHCGKVLTPDTAAGFSWGREGEGEKGGQRTTVSEGFKKKERGWRARCYVITASSGKQRETLEIIIQRNIRYSACGPCLTLKASAALINTNFNQSQSIFLYPVILLCSGFIMHVIILKNLMFVQFNLSLLSGGVLGFSIGFNGSTSDWQEVAVDKIAQIRADETEANLPQLLVWCHYMSAFMLKTMNRSALITVVTLLYLTASFLLTLTESEWKNTWAAPLCVI